MGRKAKKVGKRYGIITVLEHVKNTLNYICKCDCGVIKEISTNSLVEGITKSCGCRKKLSEGESMFNLLYKQYSQNALSRGLEWNLSREKFRELTKQKCFYCGIEPSTEQNTSIYSKSKGNHSPGMRSCNGTYIYNGVDRVENNKGYNEDNCVTCCNSCNYMKHTKTQEEFINKCRDIVKNLEKQ
jgi:hypothetical protein